MKHTICKRLTGALLSLSMLGASLCSLGYASDSDPVSTKVSLTSMYNTALEKDANGSFPLNGRGISVSYFKAETEKYQWKEAWTEGKTDNTMLFNGKEYYINNVTADGTGKALFRTFETGKNDLRRLDVADGLYQSISFLAAGNQEAPELAVRFNYTDGQSSQFFTKTVPHYTNRDQTEPSIAFAAINGAGEISYERYFREYTFDEIDSGRVLASIDILPADWEIGEDGTASKSENVLSRLYDVFILGIDLQTNASLQKEYEDMRPISAKVDFSALCNTKLETGYALTNHGIDAEKFKAESEKWQWKEAWTEGKTDNVMLLGEHEYAMKNIMPDGLALIRTYNGKNELHNIDVEDGFYQSISFLAGNGSASKLAVRFNYKDGSSQYYTKEILQWLEFDPVNRQIAVETVSGSGTAGTRRFTELVFDNIDSSRILTSIDILPGHWDVDENGNAVQQDNVPANRQCDLYILGVNIQTTLDLQKAYADLKPISVKVDMSNICNTAIDAAVLATHKLNLTALNAGGDNWQWKDEWVNTDNTIVVQDREYYIKNVTEGGTALLRTFQNGVSAPYNIPVEENIYSEVGFLAAANAGSDAYLQLAVRFNYSDNTSSGFIAQKVISSVSMDPSNPAVKMVSVNGSGGAGTRYFTDYTFTGVDNTKVLTSIDILPADWEIKPDGTAAKSVNTSSRTYDVFVMGICPMTSKDNLRANVENKIENLSDELTNADKAEMDDIYEKINTLLNYDVPESKIKGIERFRALYSRYPVVKAANDFENVYLQVEFNTDVQVSQEDFTIMDSAQKKIECTAAYENNTALLTFAKTFD